MINKCLIVICSLFLCFKQAEAITKKPQKVFQKHQLPSKIYFPSKKFHSSYPFITGETFRAYSDHIFDPTVYFDPKQVKPGDTIFVFYNYLDYFFEKLQPYIASPYILITHHFFGDSDSSVPGEKFEKYLDTPKLIAWFGAYVDSTHPKMHSLPLGISTPFYSFGDVPTFNKFLIIKDTVSKDKIAYMNFKIHTYPKERLQVYNLFKDKPFVTSIKYDFDDPHKNLSLSEYLSHVIQHKFVISPRGNGIDAFRTWEALLMGSIPIVRSSPLNRLYSDLPVVIINNWEEVTEEFLEEKFQELSSGNYNWDKLYIPYWLDQINQVKMNYLNSN